MGSVFGQNRKTDSKVRMKTICVLLALVAAASAYQQCGKKGSGSRIINGVDAGHGEFPWQISLRFGRYGHICGGTLIGNQYVLCAAHCFGQTKNPRSYTVRIGEWYLQQQDGTEKDHAVSEVHVHESYNRPKQFNNDIALMKLAKPVDFSGPYAGPACMPLARTTVEPKTACSLDGAWSSVTLRPSLIVSRRSPAESGVPASSSDNTIAFLITSLALANPTNGLPAWATPADPSSAPMAPDPTTSLASSLSALAPATADPVSLPKSRSTEDGFPRSLAELSKSVSTFLFNFSFVFVDKMR